MYGFSNPKGNHPCSCIAFYVDKKCENHPDRNNECPDRLIIKSKLGEYGLPNFDASFAEEDKVRLSWLSFNIISFCPFCGIKITR